MTVYLVIVNWNGRAYLDACLSALAGQTFRGFATTVVDNGSTDGSVDLIRKRHPGVRVLALPDNAGFCRANNLALRDVQTRYVALLNNDAVPAPGWLEALVEALDSHPEAGSAASRMVFQDRPDVIDRAGDGYTDAGAGLLRGRGEPAERYAEPAWVFGASAGAALYRTAMLRDVGLFDEDFFLLYEDVDLAFRAQLRGHACRYVPAAVVRHRASATIAHDSPVSIYYGHRNLEWVYVKNMPSGLLRRTLHRHLLYDLAAFAFFLFRGRAGVFLQAKRDALAGMRGAWEKRRGIQERRRATEEAIRALLDRERLAGRWIHRLRNSRKGGNGAKSSG